MQSNPHESWTDSTVQLRLVAGIAHRLSAFRAASWTTHGWAVRVRMYIDTTYSGMRYDLDVCRAVGVRRHGGWRGYINERLIK